LQKVEKFRTFLLTKRPHSGVQSQNIPFTATFYWKSISYI